VHIALEVDCSSNYILTPLIICLRFGFKLHKLSGPTDNQTVIDIRAQWKLEVEVVSVYLNNLGLHPTAQSATVVGLDIDVDHAAHVELLTPLLAMCAELLKFAVRNLEMVLVDHGLVVEKQGHAAVEGVVEPLLLKFNRKKFDKCHQRVSNNF
jgi:hypothetical protein